MQKQKTTWDAILVLALIYAFSFALVWALFPLFMQFVMPITDMLMAIASTYQSDFLFVIFALLHIGAVTSYLLLLPLGVAYLIVDRFIFPVPRKVAL